MYCLVKMMRFSSYDAILDLDDENLLCTKLQKHFREMVHFFWLLIGIIYGADVKLYLNECIGDLTLDNYHNYTGKALATPPNEVKTDSSVQIFEFEYASRAEFGSYLDGNLNYFQSGTKTILLHYFFNVNYTGGVYADVEDHHVLGSKICSDVELNNNKLPSVLGVYVWWMANTTYDQCKQATNEIPSCTFTL